jgi:glycosyltransferase involved in cell wall biosynthesis
MKILLHGNSPRSATGYGVQMGLLAARLVDDGHEVAVSCTHGQQTGIGAWKTPSGKTIPLFPTDDKSVGGHTIIHGHARQWFGDDPKSGWLIPLIDVPTLTPNPYLKEFNVAAWAPVDHVHVPPSVLQFFEVHKHAVLVAMSKHAETEYLRAGLDPTYIPLAVDAATYKPSPYVKDPATGEQVDARTFFGLPHNAFVVGMVAMNKGNVFDRKGFSEAFYAFGEFHRTHPNSVLFIHSDISGFSGINLRQLARYAGIPEGALIFTDQYRYATGGYGADVMAGLYTAMDVLLSPSHGEGFCVPLIEAQACGTPVIASAATAQTELVGLGAGWLVKGQPILDPGQDSVGFVPFIDDIVDALEQAYAVEGDELREMAQAAREKAQEYDADQVYAEYWRPFLASLEPPIPDADKPPMERAAVVVPAMRPQHVQELVDSFDSSNDGTARLYFVVDADNEDLIHEVDKAGFVPLVSDRGQTFAQKANYAYEHTDEDFIFLCGEDVRFTPGWLDKPRELSTRYDVIGTNDAAEGEVKNRDVAAGRHADHWFTRRTYIDDVGGCLEGPGVFCPEAYRHWWVDREVIELAKARGVFTPCLDSHVIHLHVGYEPGGEALRAADPVYMAAVEWAERDATKFRQRAALIEQHRVARR